ncbi:hypothetical protein D3C71_1734950 [compost metagenome]
MHPRRIEVPDQRQDNIDAERQDQKLQNGEITEIGRNAFYRPQGQRNPHREQRTGGSRLRQVIDELESRFGQLVPRGCRRKAERRGQDERMQRHFLHDRADDQV